MSVQVTFHEDPAQALDEARSFLAAEPVLNNLILTLLSERARHPQPGRYWVASADGTACGVVFQSPLDFQAVATPMDEEVIDAAVDTIAAQEIDLPAVLGDAATASRFAGAWTERHKIGARPEQGQRMYELAEIQEGRSASGALRQASLDDLDLIVGWMRGFEADTGERPRPDQEDAVARRISDGKYWIWQDEEPVSMAFASPAIEGVSRIGAVYTPPERRNYGYAESCVRELSRRLLAEGTRCMLYTDLANPTSNSIYRRIGYRAVAEVLRYQFGD
jgi:uncharacterized protein